jgi:Uri superfamily endonuclease
MTQIGRWGRLNINPGYYIYVGSAFGPGGVKARVLRHCRKTKPKHWHIDFLREHLEPLFAWYSYELTNLEHRWAQALFEMAAASPVKGFGSTDCKCHAHLFVFSTKPTTACFTNAVGGPVETWIYQPGEKY